MKKTNFNKQQFVSKKKKSDCEKKNVKKTKEKGKDSIFIT